MMVRRFLDVLNCSSGDDCRRGMQRRMAEQLRQLLLPRQRHTNSHWRLQHMSKQKFRTCQHHQRCWMWLSRWA